MQDPIVEPFDVVCTLDPALDRERMDVRAYGESRDPSLIRSLPGREPYVFRVRPLGAMIQAVEAGSNRATQLMQAFAYGVVEIRNWPSRGLSTKPTRLVPQVTGHDALVWDDHALFGEVLPAFGAAFIYEIGAFIYERALLGGNALSGGSMPYALPLSSLEGLARIERRSAASTPRAHETPTSAKPVSSTPPANAPSSAAPTGATATESVDRT